MFSLSVAFSQLVFDCLDEPELLDDSQVLTWVNPLIRWEA